MSHQAEDKFIENNVPILHCKEVRMEWIDKNPYVDVKEIDRAIKEAKAKLLSKKRTDIESLSLGSDN